MDENSARPEDSGVLVNTAWLALVGVAVDLYPDACLLLRYTSSHHG